MVGNALSIEQDIMNDKNIKNMLVYFIIIATLANTDIVSYNDSSIIKNVIDTITNSTDTSLSNSLNNPSSLLFMPSTNNLNNTNSNSFITTDNINNNITTDNINNNITTDNINNNTVIKTTSLLFLDELLSNQNLYEKVILFIKK